jgi:hypothetical protein
MYIGLAARIPPSAHTKDEIVETHTQPLRFGEEGAQEGYLILRVKNKSPDGTCEYYSKGDKKEYSWSGNSSAGLDAFQHLEKSLEEDIKKGATTEHRESTGGLPRSVCL